MARPQPPQRAWDDYFIPGTSVLRNKFAGAGQPYGESNPEKLTVLEEQFTRIRLAELRTNPIVGGFDYDHMKAIHGYVFQDVYEWAGEERTAPTVGPMTKEGHAYYPAGPALTEAAEAEYRKIAGANYLRGLERREFVTELAERWGELNVVHSFREGNTRTQFVFFSELCEQAGYRLDAEAFRPGNPLRDEFVQARFHGQDTGRNDRLAAVLDQVISVVPPPSTTQSAGPNLSRATNQGSSLRAASFPQPPASDPIPGPGASGRPAPGITRARGRGGPEAGR